MQPTLHAWNKNVSSYYDEFSGLLQCCQSRIRNAVLYLVVYAFSPEEAEVGRSLWIQGQIDLWKKSHVSQGYIVRTSFKQAGEQKKFTLWNDLWRIYIMSKLWVFFFFLYMYVFCTIFFWAKQNNYFSSFKMWRLLVVKHPVFYLFLFFMNC